MTPSRRYPARTLPGLWVGHLERERLWLLAWWRYLHGHRCLLCQLVRRRRWAELDALLPGGDDA